MNADRLLAHYKRIAEAPDAIARLRRFVLDLAVRGKLVPQDPEDEPAEALLKQEQILGAITEGLPANWAQVRLSSLLTLTKGKKPNRINTVGQGVPYLDIAALERGEISRFSDDTNCPGAQVGDLVLVCDGSRSGLVLDGRNGILGSTLAKVAFSGFERDYLKLLFRALYSDLNSSKKGAAIPHLNIPRLLSLVVPVPPLPEQDRIVAKVDELMALCDRLDAGRAEQELTRDRFTAASLARLNKPDPDPATFADHSRFALDNIPALTARPDQIKQLRKTILNLAVRGKLVPQDPKDGSVANLLNELARLKRRLLAEKNIRDQKVSDSPSPDDFPFSIPGEWRWARLGHAVTLLGGFAYESGAYVSASTNQIIRLGNVKNDALLLDQKPALIPDTLARQTADYAILEGDILITMTGTKAKRDYAFTLAVKSTDLAKHRLFLNQRVGAIRPFQRELVPLINTFLKSDQLLDLIFATATGTANQANIGTSSILDLPFPLPPLPEQHRIVAKVNKLMALCDQLEASLTTADDSRRRLLEALLAEALAPAKERELEAAE
jgi:type I restriction enzyme, S subunit